MGQYGDLPLLNQYASKLHRRIFFCVCVCLGVVVVVWVIKILQPGTVSCEMVSYKYPWKYQIPVSESYPGARDYNRGKHLCFRDNISSSGRTDFRRKRLHVKEYKKEAKTNLRLNISNQRNNSSCSPQSAHAQNLQFICQRQVIQQEQKA